MQKLKAPGKMKIIASVITALALSVGVTALVMGNTSGRTITNGQTVTAGNQASYSIDFTVTGDHYYMASGSYTGTAPAGTTINNSGCQHNNGGSHTRTFTIDTTAGTTAAGTYHVVGYLGEYSNATCTTFLQGWNVPASGSVNLVVTVATPTLTWDILPTKTWGDAAFSVAAGVHGPASNPGPITFATAPGSTGCTVTAAGLVSITAVATGANNCIIRATMAANSYWAARTADASFHINKDDPTVTFPAVADHAYGSGNFTISGVSATAGDTGAITFATGSGSTGCTVTSGGTVTMTGVATGTNFCVIVATVAADTHYNSASASQSFHIIKGDPTLTFPAISDRTFSTTTFSVAGGVTGPAGDTGSITFALGAGSHGCTVTSGGTVTMSGVATGTNSCVIVATIAADTHYNSATASRSFHITMATPTVTFPAISDKAFSATPFSIASGVHATTGDTGAITFALGAGSVGCTVTPAGMVTMTGLATGSNNCIIVATVAADANFNAASATQSFNIVKVDTNTNLSVSDNTPAFGQSVTFTATVTAGATGTVEFRHLFGGVIGTATVSGGTATFTTASLPTGLTLVYASYLGDGTHNGSDSGLAPVWVSNVTPTVAVTSSVNPSTIGENVTFTATLSVSGCTGTVTFKNGSATLGTATVSSGHATFSTSGLSLGNHAITAQYGGDTNCNAATSAALTQVVNLIPTTTALDSSVNPSDAGQSVTFTATVTAGATGTVTFADGGSAIGGAVTISGGQATLTTSALALGHHTITATYGGDATHATSDSNSVDQLVNALSAGFGFDLASISTQTYGNGMFGVGGWVTKAAGDDGAVTFALGAGSVGCSITPAGTVTIEAAAVGSDACVIVASIEAWEGFAGDSATSSFHIQPAQLNVQADNKSIITGAAVPDAAFYTYHVSGWVNPADAGSEYTLPTCVSAYDTSTPASTLPIDCTGGVAPANYAFNFVAGTLTVGAPAPTPTPTPTATSTATATATELVAGETGTPRAATPPPTSTSGNGNGGSATLPFALLICVAFGGLGLLVVTSQRRAIRD